METGRIIKNVMCKCDGQWVGRIHSTEVGSEKY